MLYIISVYALCIMGLMGQQILNKLRNESEKESDVIEVDLETGIMLIIFSLIWIVSLITMILTMGKVELSPYSQHVAVAGIVLLGLSSLVIKDKIIPFSILFVCHTISIILNSLML